MKWFHYYNNSDSDKEDLVSSDFNKSLGDNCLHICQQLKSRRYTGFDGFSQFSKFHRETTEDEKCFYEMIWDRNGRKPCFDIDINNGEIEGDSLIVGLMDVIEELIGTKNKMLVFTSHLESKRSYHLVVDKVYFQTYKESENFSTKVRDGMKEEWKDFIDLSVYKKVQQFRIVGSHKFGKTNTKVLDSDLSRRLKIPKSRSTGIPYFNLILQMSLVSNTGGCMPIPGFGEVLEEKINVISGSAVETDVEDVMKMFYSHQNGQGRLLFSPDDFQFSGCKENVGNLLITLRRLNPTFCHSCLRTHENENPFMTVNGPNRVVNFYCRRGEKETIPYYLGQLGTPVIPDLTGFQPPDLSSIGVSAPASDDELEICLPDIHSQLEDISFKSSPVRRKEKRNDFSQMVTSIPKGFRLTK